MWAVKSRDVGRTFLWAGALFYPIPICLGMLGLVGIAYGLKPADIGGDIVAIGPYIVSHIGIGLTLVLLYVLVILAACYSTIDGASAALSARLSHGTARLYLALRDGREGCSLNPLAASPKPTGGESGVAVPSVVEPSAKVTVIPLRGALDDSITKAVSVSGVP